MQLHAPALEQTVPLRMSYEEFLAWANEDTHAEWVNGEVIVSRPPKDIHPATLVFLIRLIGAFADLFDLGELRSAPGEMRAQPGGSSRQPDIFFTKKEHRDRLTEDRLEGPADLIVEIISRESVRRDQQEKFREYEAAGVSEYWIVDPRAGKQRADFYRLTEGGAYELFGTDDDEWVASHVLPGFRLRPAWLWQVNALDPFTALGEMRGVSAEQMEQIRRVLRGE